MNDPVSTLYHHVIKDDVYLQFMDDPDEYASSCAASAAAQERLRASLEATSQKFLDIFLDEKATADSMESEALFKAGLAFALRLLRLL